ncbi:MAG: UDP-N-acetylmuramoyl-L-alanine--D-glutamate ligase [Alphaproteobacteria bacterium]|nr:UDP-N-acetylmuramoyl-L-alanine--D-glutamate ligase [Alphaproteobacteria bacterium]
MIAARGFAGQTVGVFGLARSGVAAVRALLAGGAQVVAWDDVPARREEAGRSGAQLQHFTNWDWERIAALILSPGVPFTHPKPHACVEAAQRAGVAVFGDIELFARQIRPNAEAAARAPLIAVTGTNGKSTTTALIGHILASNGFDAQVGGNIGKPALELASPAARTVYVLEVSSYQIELAPSLCADVSVLTNISPDHIDRHGTFERYAAIKERLLLQTAKDGVRCIGVDDAHTASVHTRLTGSAGAVAVSVGKILGRGVFVLEGKLYDAQSGTAREVMDLRQVPSLPGVHNWQNAALAYAAVKPFIGEIRAIAAAIRSFPGLAHRMELVAQWGSLRIVNDSKATNADAAARALACYENILWIAGGRPKEGGIDTLAEFFPRIRKAYLIGEAAESFARTLEGHVAYELCTQLETAVEVALRDAAHIETPVLLLSPACASFDQFRDFEQRGETFRALIEARAIREAS